jgi:hypothetical protein
MKLEELEPGVTVRYVGVDLPFLVSVVPGVKPDEEGMVYVERLRDGDKCWVYPMHLESVE